MSIKQRFAALAATTLVLGGVPFVAQAAEGEPCEGTVAPGGDWSTYGGDLSNSRSQPGEEGIGLAEAPFAAKAFVYDAGGAINSTPIVDRGCVFATVSIGAGTARVVAIDTETGAEQWRTDVPIGVSAFGGPTVGSPAVFGDLVIAPVNKRGAPFMVALDRSTGAEVWRRTIDTQASSGTNASAVVHNGVVFAGFFGSAGPDSLPERGGFMLIDAATGAELAKTFVIPDHGTPDDASDQGFEDGYEGAGIWATPAFDGDYAYVGTSNPHNPHFIHERAQSILKIDVNRTSPTFGQILDSYQGIRDTILPGAEQNPACETKDDVHYYGSFSVTCLAVDVDFGSSPNLIAAADGRTLVGNLQKAGIYHLVDTADMSGVSMTPVGPPCFMCSASSTAYADGRAFVPAGPPGQLVAVDTATGVPAWVGHVTGPTTYNAPSVANGVVWSVDSGGFLNAWDALTGVQVVKRPLQQDTGKSMTAVTSSSGIAIANNTLYVAATQFIVGFRAA